jgi:hypothetical protein
MPAGVVGLFFLTCLAMVAIARWGLLQHAMDDTRATMVAGGSPESSVKNTAAYPGQEADPKTHPQQYDLVAVEKTLSQRQKVHFPQTKEQHLLEGGVSSRFLQNLLLPGYTNLRIQKLLYVDGQKGSKAEYGFVSDKHYDWLSNWFRNALGKQSTGEWNEVYGFVEYMSADMSVRVTWRRLSPGVYTIDIQSVGR